MYYNVCDKKGKKSNKQAPLNPICILKTEMYLSLMDTPRVP